MPLTLYCQCKERFCYYVKVILCIDVLTCCIKGYSGRQLLNKVMYLDICDTFRSLAHNLFQKRSKLYLHQL